MRSIVPGIRLPHLYVVSSGLNEKDRVIYEGIQQVKDGMRVNPQMISFKDIRFN
jgi:membrane fusion protein (multidrug efflux system)